MKKPLDPQPLEIRLLNSHLGLDMDERFFVEPGYLTHEDHEHGADHWTILPVHRNPKHSHNDWQTWILQMDGADDLVIRGFCIDDGMPLGNYTTTTFTYRMEREDLDDDDIHR